MLEDAMLMQVPAKKSKVVASKPSIAQAIVNAIVSDRTSTAKLTKLLTRQRHCWRSAQVHGWFQEKAGRL